MGNSGLRTKRSLQKKRIPKGNPTIHSIKAFWQRTWTFKKRRSWYNEANKDKVDFIEPILNAKAVDENGRELGFYNTSRFDFKTLLQDPDNIKFYIDSYSKNVKDILENFDIEKQIAKLSKANILYLLIDKFNKTNIDLSPKNISNHDMGTIFEELIRKFSETSNEEAGEHFTPRDVVKLMTELLFVGEEQTSGSIKLVYRKK